MAKITNPSKLLPSAKSTTAITKIGKSNFISPLKISKKSTSITKGLLGESNQKDAVDVNNKLVKVEKFFQSDLLVSKKKSETKRKEKEKEEFKKEEEKLEAPKEAKKFNLPGLSVPGMSFLDRIKRFLFFTALGWLFTKFQDQLPKLLGVVKLISGVYGVVENTFKFLLSSFVSFVERGYDAYDKIRGIAKSIGGDKAQKDFDNLSGKLNEYINYALIGGMALTGAIDAFGKQLKAEKIAKETSKKAGAKEVGKGAAQELTKRAAKKGIIQRTAQASRIGIKKGAQAVVGKQGVKQLLRLAKGPLSRLPILGALIEFGLSWALGDNPGKAAFRGVGTLLLGAVGSLILPGFGTFIGGLAGAELAGKLYEVLFENKKSQGNVQRKQGGGSVTRGGKPQGRGGPSRTLKISKRRPPKVKPRQSQPGKDVGGKKKIRELYPDPSARTDIEGRQKGAWWNLLPPLPENATPDQIAERRLKIKALPNPYKALTNTAKVLKDIPFGIGALMGGAVDIALGQKLPKDAIRGLSGGISYLITSIANRQISASISNIEKEVSKMQTGGVVRTRDFTKGSEVGPGEGIMKALDNLIYQKVDEAIKEVQKQMMPGRYNEKTAGGVSGGGEAGAGGTSGAPSISSGDAGDFSGNTKANKAFNYFKSQGYTDFQAAAIVGNLLQENRAMDPSLTNSIGMKGIAQWDGNRWSNLEKFAKSKGLSPTNFETQLQFIQEELRTGDGGLSAKTFKSTKNLEQATVLFRKQYERPGEAEANDENRIKFARSVFSGSSSIKSGSQQFTGGVLPSTKLGSGAGMRQHPLTGQLKEHAGNDYPMSAGTPISLLKGGEITRSEINGSLTSGYGNLIEIRHPDGSKSVYAHLAERRVNVGDKVNPGTIIGTVGSTGGSTGAHLHFEYDNSDGSREKNASSLNSRADQIFRFGEVKPSQVYKLAMKDGKEGIIEDGVWKPKKWTDEEKQRYKNIPSNVFKAPTKPQPSSLFTKPASSTQSSMFDWNKKQDGGVIPKQSPNRNVSSLRSYPSYADGGMMIAIQPMIIEKPVPVPMGRSRGISFPVAGVNNSTGNTPSLSKG